LVKLEYKAKPYFKEVNGIAMDAQIIDDYLAQVTRAIQTLPRQDLLKVVEVLRSARLEGKTVFVFGNGGSAATASHMVCDFSKNTRQPGKPRLKAVALNDNMPSLSAYANDEGYERVFVEQLITLANPGDVALAISGSGNSQNVLLAVEAARQIGMETVGLTGFEGGKLKDLVETCVVVPSDNIACVEDLHMVIDHVLTTILYQT
jgi:D-sedoheptulose 7-phosphate isomerase